MLLQERTYETYDDDHDDHDDNDHNNDNDNDAPQVDASPIANFTGGGLMSSNSQSVSLTPASDRRAPPLHFCFS